MLYLCQPHIITGHLVLLFSLCFWGDRRTCLFFFFGRVKCQICLLIGERGEGQWWMCVDNGRDKWQRRRDGWMFWLSDSEEAFVRACWQCEWSGLCAVADAIVRDKHRLLLSQSSFLSLNEQPISVLYTSSIVSFLFMMLFPIQTVIIKHLKMVLLCAAFFYQNNSR